MKKIFLLFCLLFSSFSLTRAENTSLTCDTTSENSTVNNTVNITKNLYEERMPKPDEKETDFILIGYQNNAGEYYISTNFLVTGILLFWGSFFVLFVFIHLSFKVWKLGQH